MNALLVKYTALLLLLLTATVTRAQKAFIYNTLQKNGFISISAGISEPLGAFGQRTGSESSGLALRGQSISLAGGYRMAGPMGLMARYEQTYHGIDPSALLNQYTQWPGDQLTATAASGRAGQWQTRSIMVGPYVTIPVGRMAFDLRALAGQIWATCPETSIQGRLARMEALIHAAGQETSALVGGVGITARYRLTPAVALHVNGDYSSATFRFNDIPLEERIGNSVQQMTISSQKKLSTAILSTGLTIQFRSRNYVF